MKAQSAGAKASLPEPTHLELMAYFGMSRHEGGWNATQEMVNLCRLDGGKHILDVGCGTGKTACYLAKEHGCQVTAVDISPRIIEWAKETAAREGVAGKIDFRVADAQTLPFEDATFDGLISESVLTFVPDRKQAIREFVRVIKPGGYLGLNESCWVRTPVPKYVTSQLESLPTSAHIEPAEYWQNLLLDEGLDVTVSSIHTLNTSRQVRDGIRWFGLSGLLRNVYRMIRYAMSGQQNRESVKKVMRTSQGMAKDVFNYYGYGVCVGRT